MPEISRFYGVRITMNYDEHLPPHFHAAYGSEEAQILIATGQILHGSLPGRGGIGARMDAACIARNWKKTGNCAKK